MKRILVILWLICVAFGVGCTSNTGSSRPVIGITSVYKADKQNESSASNSVSFTYIQAVLENGALIQACLTRK